jgi:hypothetical protein
MTNPAELIKTAIVGTPNGCLDDQVFLDRDICLSFYFDPRSEVIEYKDVSIARIVALGRPDFWKTGETSWRQAAYGLTCEGWTSRSLDYFEGEIGDSEFPAVGANGGLRLSQFGGVYECSNGNHRIVGAKVWLAYKFGCSALVKNVRVSKFSLRENLRQLLESAQEKGSSVSVSLFDINERQRIRYGEKVPRAILRLECEPGRLYVCEDETYELFELPRPRFLEWACSLFVGRREARREYRVLPAALVPLVLQ